MVAVLADVYKSSFVVLSTGLRAMVAGATCATQIQIALFGVLQFFRMTTLLGRIYLTSCR